MAILVPINGVLRSGLNTPTLDATGCTWQAITGMRAFMWHSGTPPCCAWELAEGEVDTLQWWS